MAPQGQNQQRINLVESASAAGRHAGGDGIRGDVGAVAGVVTMAVGSPFVVAGGAAEALLPWGKDQPSAVEHADIVYREHGNTVKKFVDLTDSVTGGLLGPVPGAAAGLAANVAILPLDILKFSGIVGKGVVSGILDWFE